MSLIWSASKARMVLLRTFPAAPTRNTSVAAVSSSGASATMMKSYSPIRQAVARPSEVNQRRQKTATAGRTTCRPEAIRPAMDLLPIDEHHIYDI
jgi:hypothetical protein